MRLKSDTTFKEELTFGFKYDMRSLVNFHSTTKKSENFISMGSFCPKYIRFELKTYRGIIFMTLNSDVKFEYPDLLVSKMA